MESIVPAHAARVGVDASRWGDAPVASEVTIGWEGAVQLDPSLTEPAAQQEPLASGRCPDPAQVTLSSPLVAEATNPQGTRASAVSQKAVTRATHASRSSGWHDSTTWCT